MEPIEVFLILWASYCLACLVVEIDLMLSACIAPSLLDASDKSCLNWMEIVGNNYLTESSHQAACELMRHRQYVRQAIKRLCNGRMIISVSEIRSIKTEWEMLGNFLNDSNLLLYELERLLTHHETDPNIFDRNHLRVWQMEVKDLLQKYSEIDRCADAVTKQAVLGN